MAHEVFISYSHKDKAVADAACAVLEANGIRCWIAPRDILPGAAWAASIPPAIRAAKVFLLIFSSSANESEQVPREVDLAATRRLAIIPLRVENVLPQSSLEYYIQERHWLDAFTPPLHQHLDRLVAAIRLLLQDGTAAEPHPALVVPAPRPSALSPRVLAGVAAIAVVLLAVAGWFAFHPAASPPAPVAVTAPPPSGVDYSREDAAEEPATPATHKQSAIIPRRYCAAQTMAGGVTAQFCATSVLGAQNDATGRSNSYGPQNLFDGNRATAWCEGVDGPGNGQEIAVTFSRPMTVDAITFVNGYAKSDATFARNNSIHTLTATWSDGRRSSIDLADQAKPFSVAGHAGAVTGVTFRIETVNGGSKWPDTCLSEIAFATREL